MSSPTPDPAHPEAPDAHQRGGLAHAQEAHMTEPEPELYGDDILPLEDDTIEQQIDGEHPDGDWDKWDPSIYDDDPDDPEDDIEPAVDEDEEVD